MQDRSWRDYAGMWRKSLEDFSLLTGLATAITDATGGATVARSGPARPPVCELVADCRNSEICPRWQDALRSQRTLFVGCAYGLVGFVVPVSSGKGALVGRLAGGPVILATDPEGANWESAPLGASSATPFMEIAEQVARCRPSQLTKDWWHQHALELGVDPATLLGAVERTPRYSEAKLVAAARLLHEIGRVVSRSVVQTSRVSAAKSKESRESPPAPDDPRTIGRKILLHLSREVASYRKACLQLLRGDSRIPVAIVDESSAREVEPDPVLHRPVTFDRLIQDILEKREPFVMEDVNEFASRHGELWGATSATEDVRSWVCLPLVQNDNVVGLITLDHDEAFHFKDDPAFKTDLRLFAERSATAVAQAVSFYGARSQIRDLTTVNSLIHQTSVWVDIKEMLDAVLDSIVKELDCTHCTVFLAERQSRAVILRAKASRGGNALALRASFKRGEGIAWQVFSERRSALIADTSKEPNYKAGLHETGAPRSMLVVPIRVGDQAIGVVSAHQDALGWFTRGDRELLEALGTHLGGAIQRANGTSHLGILQSQLLALRDTDEILQYVVTRGIELVNASTGVIYLLEGDDDAPHRVEAMYRHPEFDHPAPRLEDPRGITRYVWTRGEPLYIADLSAPPAGVVPCTALLERYKSTVAVPIRAQNRTIGVFFVDDEDEHHWTPVDRALLQQLSALAGIAIQNAEERKRLNRAVARREDLERALADIVGLHRDVPTTLVAITSRIGGHFQQRVTTTITLYDSKRDSFGRCYATGPLADLFQSTPREESLSRHVLASQEGAVFLDTATAPPEGCPATPKDIVAAGVVSVAGVRLRHRGRNLGVLFVNSQERVAFTESDQRDLMGFAEKAALAIEIARHEEASVRRQELDETTKLREIALAEYVRESCGRSDAALKVPMADEPLLLIGRRWNSWYPSFFSADGGAYAVVDPRLETRGAIIDPGFRALATLRALGVPVGVLDSCIVTHNHADHVAGLFEFLAARHVIKKATALYPVKSVFPIVRDYAGADFSVTEFDTLKVPLIAEFDRPRTHRNYRITATPFETSHSNVGPSAGATRGVTLESAEHSEGDAHWTPVASAVLLGDTEYDPLQSPTTAVFQGIREQLHTPNLRVVVLHIGSAQLKNRMGGHLYLTGLIDVLKELDYYKSQHRGDTKKLLVLVSEWGLEHASATQVAEAIQGPNAVTDGLVSAFDESLLMRTVQVARDCIDTTRLTVLAADLGLWVGLHSGNLYVDGKALAPETVQIRCTDKGLVYSQA
jgi:GAF domain-containing protein